MRRRLALGALALAVAALALVVAGVGSAKHCGDAVQGGLDLRRAAQRRRLVAGARRRAAVRPEDARQQGPDDLQGEHRASARSSTRRSRASSSQGYKMIFATSYGYVDQAGRGEVPERQVRAGDRDGRRQEPVRVLRRGRGHGLPVRDGGRCGLEDRQHRLRRRVPDPRGHPARERVRARRAADASGREGAASSGRTPGTTRRRRRRRRRASSPTAPTCSARTSTRRRPASTPSRRGSRGSGTTPTPRSSRRSRG